MKKHTCNLTAYNPNDPEDCTACWVSPGPCPYHQGVIDATKPEWVHVDRPDDSMIGKVVRVEGDCGITHEGTLNGWGAHFKPVYFDGSEMGFDGAVYVRPEDAPDPDAELIDVMARRIASDEGECVEDWGSMYHDRARSALAAIREREDH